MYIFLWALFIICCQLVLTQDGLHRHPQEPLHVALLVDDGDAVDERNGVHQVREVDEGAADQPEPGGRRIFVADTDTI